MDKKNNYFHDAEITLQKRVNAYEHIAKISHRMLHSEMPAQHSEFYENIPFVIAGMLDDKGRPWAMPISGPNGYIEAPDSSNLLINALPTMHKTLSIKMSVGQKIGLLGIDLSNRRRNRMNGSLKKVHSSGFMIGVEQSYGNCPKYIQLRDIEWEHTPSLLGEINRSTQLTTNITHFIQTADTFFIASRTADMDQTPHHGIDASHRGGQPGFVNAISDTTLLFPDFSGNRLFNTLGNIESDGRVGLFFPNYENGDAVFITGKGRIIWDPKQVSTFEGAERLIQIEVDEVVHTQAALSTRGTFVETSPFLQNTGPWKK